MKRFAVSSVQRQGLAFAVCLRGYATKLFTATHEWVEVEGTMATVGITNHAQEALGDIVYVGLPDINDALQAKEAAADIESVKATSDIYSPLAGTVTEVNNNVKTTPALVNTNAENDAWLFKLKDVKAPEGLMTKAQYDEFLVKSAH